MHDQPHDRLHGNAHNSYPRPGHNNPPTEHLHSHTLGDAGRERREEIQALAASLLEGFRNAADKTSFLRMAGIPLRLKGDGGLALHLVDVAIASNYQVGTASPGFATREISYLPFPGELVTARERMVLTYVSLTRPSDRDLVDLIAERLTARMPGG